MHGTEFIIINIKALFVEFCFNNTDTHYKSAGKFIFVLVLTAVWNMFSIKEINLIQKFSMVLMIKNNNQKAIIEKSVELKPERQKQILPFP